MISHRYCAVSQVPGIDQSQCTGAGMQGSAEHKTHPNSRTASAFTSPNTSTSSSCRFGGYFIKLFLTFTQSARSRTKRATIQPRIPYQNNRPRQRDLRAAPLESAPLYLSLIHHAQGLGELHIPPVTVCCPRKPTRLCLPGQRRCRIHGI
jgi:hypothetical protein